MHSTNMPCILVKQTIYRNMIPRDGCDNSLDNIYSDVPSYFYCKLPFGGAKVKVAQCHPLDHFH